MFILMISFFMECYPKLNMFFHVVFRSFSTFLTSFFISLFLGQSFISFLHRLEFRQVVRNNGPKSHFSKNETPTMGGLVIFFSIFLSVLIWADLFNVYVWFVLFVLCGYCIIGFIDDYYKILRKNSIGLSVFWKFFWLLLIAFLISSIIFIFNKHVVSTHFIIPFFTDIMPDLGLWYMLLSCCVIVSTGNAVNLSDGLDGLVIMPIVFIAAALVFVSSIISNSILAYEFHLPYLVLAKELIIVCAAIIGASLGFLWFNSYPAQIFMGDVGSLGLGGSIGIIVVLLHQELLLLIMAGVFVMETLSVILQVFYFKLFRRRIFLMAPIHHHFELKGYLEPHIVVRFWIISLILVFISLLFLTLR